MLFLFALALRFIQSCVFITMILDWMGLDPQHPAVRTVRAVAEPFLKLVRPLARKLPGPNDWVACAIVLVGLDLLRQLLGGW